MGEILKFEKEEPHLSGEAICSSCKHEWAAVAPVGTKELQCPNCLTNKGLFANPVSPRGDNFWECHCGCNLFFILEDGSQCYECGNIQNF